MRSKWQVVVVGITLLILSGCGKPEIGKTDVSYFSEAVVRKDGAFHGVKKVNKRSDNIVQIAFNKDGSFVEFSHGYIEKSDNHRRLGDFYLYDVGKWSKTGSLIREKDSFQGTIVRYQVDSSGKRIKHPTYEYLTQRNSDLVYKYHFGKEHSLTKAVAYANSTKQLTQKFVNTMPQKAVLNHAKSAFKAKVKQLHATKE